MYPQQPRSYAPQPPRPRPNYTLRRAMALTGVLLVVWLLLTMIGGIFGGGGGGDDDVASDDGDGSPATSTSSTTEPVTAVVVPPPCEQQDAETAYSQPGDWNRTIVDPTYAIPNGYSISDLTSAGAAGYAEDIEVRSFMIEDLNRMREAILAANTPEVAIDLGYRSPEQQQVILDAIESRSGIDEALRVEARPRHSEHQLGTAVDFRPIGTIALEESFATHPTGEWLAANAWQYGFIMSYPAGAETLTCNRFEPWHFRYVGVDLAARINATGLPLRQYLWHWQTTGSEPTAAQAAVPSTPSTTPTDPSATGDADTDAEDPETEGDG